MIAEKRTELLTFVRERERIRLRCEAGDKPPHAEPGSRLRDYWFPNIRRSDDPATVWLHFALLAHLDKPQEIILAATAFRLFGGWVPTGELIAPMFWGSGYSETLFLEQLGPVKLPSNPHVPRQLRASTLAAAAGVLETLHEADSFWHLLRGASLREATGALTKIRGIGPEMAYEIVCDLRRTPVLQGALDVRTWAQPSRGVVFAAEELLGRELGCQTMQGKLETVALMRQILAQTEREFPDWELAEVQRALGLFYTWTRESKPQRRYRWR